MKYATLRTWRKGAAFVKRIWRHGFNPGSPPAFVFAVACVVVAALTRHLLGLIDPAIVVFAPYFPAVLIATLIGGLPSGLITLVLGALSAWWSFIPPTHAFFPITQDRAISLLIDCATGAIIMIAAESHRRLLRQHYEKEHFDQLIIGELQHRLRNKLATVQAILRRELRNDNDLRKAVEGRLAAVMRTDELMLKSRDKSVKMGDIIKGELEPYGISSRIRVADDLIILPAPLALSLTLVVHEIATNAAKYGALSTPSARIDVNWMANGTYVQMTWTESGGPNVPYPTRKGLGLELLQQALLPFHGTVEPVFAAHGLIWKIAFSLPDERRLLVGFSQKSASPSQSLS